MFVLYGIYNSNYSCSVQNSIVIKNVICEARAHVAIMFEQQLAVTLNLSLFLREWLALFHCPHNHPISVRAVWTDSLCSCSPLWYMGTLSSACCTVIQWSPCTEFLANRGGLCWVVVIIINKLFIWDLAYKLLSFLGGSTVFIIIIIMCSI